MKSGRRPARPRWIPARTPLWPQRVGDARQLRRLAGDARERRIDPIACRDRIHARELDGSHCSSPTLPQPGRPFRRGQCSASRRGRRHPAKPPRPAGTPAAWASTRSGRRPGTPTAPTRNRPSATSSQAYSSGVRATAHPPSPSRWTTPLVSTAKTPQSDPDTKANSTAATAPPQIRAATTHPSSSGPSTIATAAQVRSDARESPACGLPTVTITVTAAVSTNGPEPLPAGHRRGGPASR